MNYNDDRHIDDGMRHGGLVPTKTERENARLRKRIAELESVLAAFESWASPLVNGDDGCGVWYGQGLPQIVTQARVALFAAKAPTECGQ